MTQGGLLQLAACGVSDRYILAWEQGNEECSNKRDSMMYWFVERDDGFPLKEDLAHDDPFRGRILHAPDITLPFDIRREKAAARIQAWFKEALKCRSRFCNIVRDGIY